MNARFQRKKGRKEKCKKKGWEKKTNKQRKLNQNTGKQYTKSCISEFSSRITDLLSRYLPLVCPPRPGCQECSLGRRNGCQSFRLWTVTWHLHRKRLPKANRGKNNGVIFEKDNHNETKCWFPVQQPALVQLLAALVNETICYFMLSP